jgi:hypothetical protein
MPRKWLQLRRVRILGARVHVHWSAFAVVLLLLLVSVRSPIYAAIAIASYLGMIFLHETGRAWVARRLGYRVDALYVAFLHGRCGAQRSKACRARRSGGSTPRIHPRHHGRSAQPRRIRAGPRRRQSNPLRTRTMITRYLRYIVDPGAS